MESIEGRAEKFADANYVTADCFEAAQNGYIKGATEQRQIDIDKACEWIKEHRDWFVDTEDCGITGCINDDFFIEFRKAMEDKK